MIEGWRWARGGLLALLLLGGSGASADDGPLATLRVEPVGPAHPHWVWVTVRAGAEPVDLHGDLRLLSLTLPRPARGRAPRCSRRAPPLRRVPKVRLAAGEEWKRWIDLRQVCWGRSLAALAAGGEIEARWARGGVRPAEGRRRARRLEATFTLAATASEAETEAPVRARLLAASARTERGLRFRVRASARSEPVRVYVRPSSWRFRVVAADGTATACRMPDLDRSPPPDLFRRLRGRRAWPLTLDASAFCPEGTFARPGVYEVTPTLVLGESGATWALDALTGSFEGRTTPVRIDGGTEPPWDPTVLPP